MSAIGPAASKEDAAAPLAISEDFAATPIDAEKAPSTLEDKRKRNRFRLPRSDKRPVLLKLRSSEIFITFVVGYGVFVDMFVYGLAAPVVPFRLRQLGYENVASLTGWLVAAYSGGLIVSSPVIGWWGEKVQGRQLPLLIALCSMAGALVMFMLSTTFALLLVSRILQGISGTAIFTLGFALLADCVGSERLAFAAGNAMIGISLGGIMGPVLGGVLYDHLGYYSVWICGLIFVFFDFVFRIVIIEPYKAEKWFLLEPLKTLADGTTEERKPRIESQANLPGATKAFVKASYNPRVVASMLLSVGIGVWFGCIDSALTLRLNQRYGLNSTGAGLVFIGFAVPALFFSPLSGWVTDRIGGKPVAIFGMLLACPFVALLCINSMNLAAFVACLTLLGCALAIPLPPCSADLADVVRETPALGFSHAFSYFNLSFSVGAFIGPLIAGNVLEGLGIERGWYTVVGISVLFFLIPVPVVWYTYPAWKNPFTKKVRDEKTGVTEDGKSPEETIDA